MSASSQHSITWWVVGDEEEGDYPHEDGWYAARADVERLLEQVESMREEMVEMERLGYEANEREKRLEEQNESYRRIIDNVLLYLQRSQFLVGADALIEDIQAALSNPASDPLKDALHLLADEAMESGMEIGEAIEERRAQSPAKRPQ